MNALDEQSKGTSRSRKGTVRKVVKISRNDLPGLNFALRYFAESIFHYKISFTVYCQGVNSEKLFGFGAHYFDLQVVKKSLFTSTEGP